MFSHYIEKLKEFAKEYDFTVEIDMDLDGSGRIYYEKNLIVLNTSSAKDTAIVLAHEIGHLLSAVLLSNIGIKKNDLTIDKRELLADELGWLVARIVGLDTLINEDEYLKVLN